MIISIEIETKHNVLGIRTWVPQDERHGPGCFPQMIELLMS